RMAGRDAGRTPCKPPHIGNDDVRTYRNYRRTVRTPRLDTRSPGRTARRCPWLPRVHPLAAPRRRTLAPTVKVDDRYSVGRRVPPQDCTQPHHVAEPPVRAVFFAHGRQNHHAAIPPRQHQRLRVDHDRRKCSVGRRRTASVHVEIHTRCHPCSGLRAPTPHTEVRIQGNTRSHRRTSHRLLNGSGTSGEACPASRSTHIRFGDGHWG